jgi:hypothetical protein
VFLVFLVFPFSTSAAHFSLLFPGSNNLNLLFPSGQFGTRSQGGKDAASPRYIFTYLCPSARAVFPEQDDLILNYLNDDGESIEPDWYLPVLPMVLVNGCSGIGTGWSTDVPNYNPRDIVANLKKMLNGEEPTEMTPWSVSLHLPIFPSTYLSISIALLSLLLIFWFSPPCLLQYHYSCFLWLLCLLFLSFFILFSYLFPLF